MKYFMENEGKSLSRDELLSNIWGYEFYGESRTLDVHVKEIRKKLFKLTQKKNIIETIHGVGYEMNL
jgi:DNA-binding response OmpR family regulator